MKKTELAEITKKVRKLTKDCPGFRPFTNYDAHLQRLEVIAEECSITEHMITPGFIILERNHPEKKESKKVGFVIERPLDVCKQLGLPTQGKVRMSTILQKIVLASYDPKAARMDENLKKAIFDFALPLVEDHYPELNDFQFP